MKLPRAAAALVAACLAAPAAAAPLDRAQRACVLELNERAAAVVSIQTAEALRCQ